MKHCLKCNKEVNVIRNQVSIGIADIWNDHCEECGTFVDSGFSGTPQGDALNKFYQENKDDEETP